MLNLKFLFIISILSLQWPTYTKNWTGSDTPGHSFASFEDFSGKQSFKVKLSKNEKFIFKYKTLVEKGKLRLVIKSSTQTVLDKELSNSSVGELTVENPKNEQYKFIFIGSHADGSFEITYQAL